MVSTIFCTSGAALIRAGVNVNAALTAGTVKIGTDFIVDLWINEAESMINSLTRKNWSDKYGTLNADVKYILNEAAAAGAGMKCVSYDMGGYTRQEACIILDVLRDTFVRDIDILKDQKTIDYMDGA